MSYAAGSSLTYGLAALVAAPFLVLPGLGIAWGLGRRAGWGLGQIVAAAFAFGLLVVGVVSLAAHYASLSLAFVVGASAVVFVALTVAGILLGRGKGERPASEWQGLALALAAALLAVWQKPWFAHTADTFYHLAAVRSLLVTGRPMVTDPFYGTGIRVLDPTSGVWHTALAAVSRVTGLDPVWLWPGATAVGAAMTVLGFWVLAKRVGGSAWAASVATLGLAAFPLALDMRWMAYPNHMSLALVFVALGAIADLLERPTFSDAALLVAAGFAAISLHMASAAIVAAAAVFLGVLLLVDVVERARSGAWELRPLVAYAGAGLVVALVSAAVILPKAGVVVSSSIVGYQAETLASKVQTLEGGWMIARPSLFGDHWSTLLFATLLGLAAAVPAFGRGDRRALAVAGICLLPAALLLDPPLSTALLRSSFYLSARIAALLRFPLYVGVAWGLAALAAARRGEPVRRASAVLAAAALAVALYANAAPLRALFAPASADASTFASSRSADIRTMWGPETVRKMAAEIGTGYPVVAGDFEATYYLAGLLPVRVVAAPPRHAPFAIEVRDGERRRKDIETLLDPHTPEAVRREIIARRDVSYVLVSPTSRALKNALKTLNAEPDLFEPVVAGRSTVLFRVRR